MEIETDAGIMSAPGLGLRPLRSDGAGEADAAAANCGDGLAHSARHVVLLSQRSEAQARNSVHPGDGTSARLRGGEAGLLQEQYNPELHDDEDLHGDLLFHSTTSQPHPWLHQRDADIDLLVSNLVFTAGSSSSPGRRRLPSPEHRRQRMTRLISGLQESAKTPVPLNKRRAELAFQKLSDKDFLVGRGAEMMQLMSSTRRRAAGAGGGKMMFAPLAAKSPELTQRQRDAENYFVQRTRRAEEERRRMNSPPPMHVGGLRGGLSPGQMQRSRSPSPVNLETATANKPDALQTKSKSKSSSKAAAPSPDKKKASKKRPKTATTSASVDPKRFLCPPAAAQQIAPRSVRSDVPGLDLRSSNRLRKSQTTAVHKTVEAAGRDVDGADIMEEDDAGMLGNSNQYNFPDAAVRGRKHEMVCLVLSVSTHSFAKQRLKCKKKRNRLVVLQTSSRARKVQPLSILSPELKTTLLLVLLSRSRPMPKIKRTLRHHQRHLQAGDQSADQVTAPIDADVDPDLLEVDADTLENAEEMEQAPAPPPPPVVKDLKYRLSALRNYVQDGKEELKKEASQRDATKSALRDFFAHRGEEFLEKASEEQLAELELEMLRHEAETAEAERKKQVKRSAAQKVKSLKSYVKAEKETLKKEAQGRQRKKSQLAGFFENRNEEFLGAQKDEEDQDGSYLLGSTRDSGRGGLLFPTADDYEKAATEKARKDAEKDEKARQKRQSIDLDKLHMSRRERGITQLKGMISDIQDECDQQIYDENKIIAEEAKESSLSPGGGRRTKSPQSRRPGLLEQQLMAQAVSGGLAQLPAMIKDSSTERERQRERGDDHLDEEDEETRRKNALSQKLLHWNSLMEDAHVYGDVEYADEESNPVKKEAESIVQNGLVAQIINVVREEKNLRSARSLSGERRGKSRSRSPAGASKQHRPDPYAGVAGYNFYAVELPLQEQRELEHPNAEMNFLDIEEQILGERDDLSGEELLALREKILRIEESMAGRPPDHVAMSASHIDAVGIASSRSAAAAATFDTGEMKHRDADHGPRRAITFRDEILDEPVDDSDKKRLYQLQMEFQAVCDLLEHYEAKFQRQLHDRTNSPTKRSPRGSSSRAVENKRPPARPNLPAFLAKIQDLRGTKFIPLRRRLRSHGLTKRCVRELASGIAEVQAELRLVVDRKRFEEQKAAERAEFVAAMGGGEEEEKGDDDTTSDAGIPLRSQMVVPGQNSDENVGGYRVSARGTGADRTGSADADPFASTTGECAGVVIETAPSPRQRSPKGARKEREKYVEPPLVKPQFRGDWEVTAESVAYKSPRLRNQLKRRNFIELPRSVLADEPDTKQFAEDGEVEVLDATAFPPAPCAGSASGARRADHVPFARRPPVEKRTDWSYEYADISVPDMVLRTEQAPLPVAFERRVDVDPSHPLSAFNAHLHSQQPRPVDERLLLESCENDRDAFCRILAGGYVQRLAVSLVYGLFVETRLTDLSPRGACRAGLSYCKQFVTAWLQERGPEKELAMSPRRAALTATGMGLDPSTGKLQLSPAQQLAEQMGTTEIGGSSSSTSPSYTKRATVKAMSPRSRARKMYETGVLDAGDGEPPEALESSTSERSPLLKYVSVDPIKDPEKVLADAVRTYLHVGDRKCESNPDPVILRYILTRSAHVPRVEYLLPTWKRKRKRSESELEVAMRMQAETEEDTDALLKYVRRLVSRRNDALVRRQRKLNEVEFLVPTELGEHDALAAESARLAREEESGLRRDAWNHARAADGVDDSFRETSKKKKKRKKTDREDEAGATSSSPSHRKRSKKRKKKDRDQDGAKKVKVKQMPKVPATIPEDAGLTLELDLGDGGLSLQLDLSGSSSADDGGEFESKFLQRDFEDAAPAAHDSPSDPPIGRYPAPASPSTRYTTSVQDGIHDVSLDPPQEWTDELWQRYEITRKLEQEYSHIYEKIADPEFEDRTSPMKFAPGAGGENVRQLTSRNSKRRRKKQPLIRIEYDDFGEVIDSKARERISNCPTQVSKAYVRDMTNGVYTKLVTERIMKEQLELFQYNFYRCRVVPPYLDKLYNDLIDDILRKIFVRENLEEVYLYALALWRKIEDERLADLAAKRRREAEEERLRLERLKRLKEVERILMGGGKGSSASSGAGSEVGDDLSDDRDDNFIADDPDLGDLRAALGDPVLSPRTSAEQARLGGHTSNTPRRYADLLAQQAVAESKLNKDMSHVLHRYAEHLDYDLRHQEVRESVEEIETVAQKTKRKTKKEKQMVRNHYAFLPSIFELAWQEIYDREVMRAELKLMAREDIDILTEEELRRLAEEEELRRRGILEKQEFARVLLSFIYMMAIERVAGMDDVADAVVGGVLNVGNYFLDERDAAPRDEMLFQEFLEREAAYSSPGGEESVFIRHLRAGKSMEASEQHHPDNEGPFGADTDSPLHLPVLNIGNADEMQSVFGVNSASDASYFEHENDYLVIRSVATVYVDYLTDPNKRVNGEMIDLAKSQAESIRMMQDEVRRLRENLRMQQLMGPDFDEHGNALFGDGMPGMDGAGDDALFQTNTVTWKKAVQLQAWFRGILGRRKYRDALFRKLRWKYNRIRTGIASARFRESPLGFNPFVLPVMTAVGTQAGSGDGGGEVGDDGAQQREHGDATWEAQEPGAGEIEGDATQLHTPELSSFIIDEDVHDNGGHHELDDVGGEAEAGNDPGFAARPKSAHPSRLRAVVKTKLAFGGTRKSTEESCGDPDIDAEPLALEGEGVMMETNKSLPLPGDEGVSYGSRYGDAGHNEDDAFAGDDYEDFDRLETESGPAVLVVTSPLDEDDPLLASIGRDKYLRSRSPALLAGDGTSVLFPGGEDNSWNKEGSEQVPANKKPLAHVPYFPTLISHADFSPRYVLRMRQCRSAPNSPRLAYRKRRFVAERSRDPSSKYPWFSTAFIEQNYPFALYTPVSSSASDSQQENKKPPVEIHYLEDYLKAQLIDSRRTSEISEVRDFLEFLDADFFMHPVPVEERLLDLQSLVRAVKTIVRKVLSGGKWQRPVHNSVLEAIAGRHPLGEDKEITSAERRKRDKKKNAAAGAAGKGAAVAEIIPSTDLLPEYLHEELHRCRTEVFTPVELDLLSRLFPFWRKVAETVGGAAADNLLRNQGSLPASASSSTIDEQDRTFGHEKNFIEFLLNLRTALERLVVQQNDGLLQGVATDFMDTPRRKAFMKRKKRMLRSRGLPTKKLVRDIYASPRSPMSGGAGGAGGHDASRIFNSATNVVADMSSSSSSSEDGNMLQNIADYATLGGPTAKRLRHEHLSVENWAASRSVHSADFERSYDDGDHQGEKIDDELNEILGRGLKSVYTKRPLMKWYRESHPIPDAESFARNLVRARRVVKQEDEVQDIVQADLNKNENAVITEFLDLNEVEQKNAAFYARREREAGFREDFAQLSARRSARGELEGVGRAEEDIFLERVVPAKRDVVVSDEDRNVEQRDALTESFAASAGYQDEDDGGREITQCITS
eukprot:g1487.t1